MMTLRATVLCCSLLAMGCLPAMRSISVRSDARLQGGTETIAKVDVPGHWFQTVATGDRAELMGADNFSLVKLSVQPVLADASNCPAFARRVAEENFQGSSTQDVVSTPEHPYVVDYHLAVPGPVSGPSERVVVGRAVCQNGGMVSLTCSTGHLKAETIAACETVMASLRIEGSTPTLPETTVPPPVPPETPAPVPVPIQAN